MNKKGQFVALLSLFLVLGLIAVYFIVDKGTSEVTKMYYTPTDVLNQNFEVKEYLFNLNQDIKYDSFSAFESFSLNSGFKLGGECEAWYECELDLIENFKSYLNKPSYNVGVEIVDGKFVINYVYDGEKVFEEMNVKTSFIPKAEYTLDYDISIFEELYSRCRDVVSCDDLDDCGVSECDDSGDNILLEYSKFEDNKFIKPEIKFKISKQGVLI